MKKSDSAEAGRLGKMLGRTKPAAPLSRYEPKPKSIFGRAPPPKRRSANAQLSEEECLWIAELVRWR